jgi:hypothetical protein
MAAKSVVKQARFDQFASLFDDVPRVDLRRGLAELLHTPDSQLPARLEEVGDELLFHFFSDSKARENFRAQISPRLITSAAKGKGRAKSTTKPKTGVADELAVTASPILAAHLHKAVKQL